MFSVMLEPPTLADTGLTARIPVGRDDRRNKLGDIGWAIEHASTSTRYYTKQFIAGGDLADTVRAISEAYQLVYETRAEELRWTVAISPQWPAGTAPRSGPSRRRARRSNEASGPIPSSANLRDRMVTRARAQPLTTLSMAAVGLGVSIMFVTDFAKTWTMSSPVAVLIHAGGARVAAATYLSGLPTRLAGANADFWGGGVPTRLVTAAGFSTVAALIWGLAMMFLFESRLPG